MNDQNTTTNKIPLVVDLDGTFVNTDLFIEGLVTLIRKDILYLFKCFFCLLKGLAYLKQKVFENVDLKYDLIPVNKELLDFLKSEKKKGRKLILATASPKTVAIEIANIYPIFDEIYGTEENTNLKGKNKRDLLIKRFGEKGFDYIGNSHADFVIFASAHQSYLVNPSNQVQKKTKKVSSLQKVWKTSKNTFRSYLKMIRIYQWVKNLLLFLPIITSHSYHSLDMFLQVIIAFVAFGFIASAGYIINDVWDINADRSHPRKRDRAIPSGNIPILSGLYLSGFLLIVGLVGAYFLSFQFFLILLLYFSLSLAYSISLKRFVLYDVFLLASFYTIRVIAGGIITGIPISFWLISFSIFLFLSLSFVKRYSEIFLIKIDDENNRRGYSKLDIPLLQIMGIACGLLSVIVFSMYINSPEVVLLYSKPHLLWFASLLLLLWISQIWLTTSRGKMTDDPIVFMMKDYASIIKLVIAGIILFISM